MRAKGIAAFTDESQSVYFQRGDTISGITMHDIKTREVLDNVAVLIGLALDRETYTNALHAAIDVVSSTR